MDFGVFTDSDVVVTRGGTTCVSTATSLQLCPVCTKHALRVTCVRDWDWVQATCDFINKWHLVCSVCEWSVDGCESRTMMDDAWGSGKIFLMELIALLANSVDELQMTYTLSSDKTMWIHKPTGKPRCPSCLMFDTLDVASWWDDDDSPEVKAESFITTCSNAACTLWFLDGSPQVPCLFGSTPTDLCLSFCTVDRTLVLDEESTSKLARLELCLAEYEDDESCVDAATLTISL